MLKLICDFKVSAISKLKASQNNCCCVQCATYSLRLIIIKIIQKAKF